MRYLFDIGHPAEFHYFKYVMKALRKKGNKILVTARDKDVTLELLKISGLDYICTGRNVPNRLGKVLSLFRNDYHILKAVKRFQPDIIVNFFSPFAAHAGWLTNKPVIGFHDTENATISIMLAKPFTDIIIVPECYTRNLPQKKVIFFKGYFELAYLHPNYFIPDPSILNLLGLKKNEKYVFFRFVSHSALHDIGKKGLPIEIKRRAVTEMAKFARVFISSEEKLPDDLKEFKIYIPTEKIHDVLYYAGLCFGESATMSSESAMLGTPAIFIDQKGLGYTNELEKKYGLLFNFSLHEKSQQQSIVKGIELLKDQDNQKWQKKRKKLLSENIDVSAFMLWFIENYPESVKVMKENPAYCQLRFK